LFGEGPSRILLSLGEESWQALSGLASAAVIPLKICGRVTSGEVRVVYNDKQILSMGGSDLFRVWDGALESWMVS